MSISPSVLIRWLQSWKKIGLILWILGPFMIFFLGAYRLQPKVTALTNWQFHDCFPDGWPWPYPFWTRPKSMFHDFFLDHVLWRWPGEPPRHLSCLIFLLGATFLSGMIEPIRAEIIILGCNKYPFPSFSTFCFSSVSLPAGFISWPTGPRVFCTPWVIRESMSDGYTNQIKSRLHDKMLHYFKATNHDFNFKRPLISALSPKVTRGHCHHRRWQWRSHLSGEHGPIRWRNNMHNVKNIAKQSMASSYHISELHASQHSNYWNSARQWYEWSFICQKWQTTHCRPNSMKIWEV